jgi:hypothetical protein
MTEEEWIRKALNAQGDLIYSTIVGMGLSKNSKATLDLIDKALVKSGHDLTRQQIRAGAENALERELLDKERYDGYFIPIQGQPRKHKPKQRKGAA